ncbi:hypothetical protein [Roseibium aggregatum]|uniref:Uncharacterized protein n=1 Tax=Roseibium aggregatum TaxID=187304 RepID=A0A926NZ61_9HYPH|nr:hypothetical protein [Roseibium aggregatum]MBD1545968.1 hypothetical protein [Roseibium aggregatum]
MPGRHCGWSIAAEKNEACNRGGQCTGTAKIGRATQQGSSAHVAGRLFRPAIDVDRSVDVFQLASTDLRKPAVDLPDNLVGDDAGNTYSARGSQWLEACRYIQAVAEDIVPGNGHISEMKSDAERKNIRFAFGEVLLNGQSGLYGGDSAWKSRDDAVTGGLDNMAAIEINMGVDNLTRPADGLQRGRLVFFHPPAEANCISHKQCCQLTFQRTPLDRRPVVERLTQKAPEVTATA